MPIQAVFFDAGETLVHPYPSFPELLASVLQQEGYTADTNVIHATMHVVSDRFAQAGRDRELWSTSGERSKKFWMSIYERFLTDMRLPLGNGLAERLYTTFTDLSNYRLFPDALPVLDELQRRRIRMGLISNFEDWLEQLLDALEVTRYFEVRIISGVEGLEKPDPGIFHLALDRTGVRPGDSAYVGDNPIFDVAPAAEAGMLPILIDRRDRYPQHEGIRITSLEDLPAAIGLDT